MEITDLFSRFCAVQHRLSVSPGAAALFCFILGEISNTDSDAGQVALANSRICGTIHISNAALRKCRDELIAAGIISFTSADNGKTLALYALLDPAGWKLDVVVTAGHSECSDAMSSGENHPGVQPGKCRRNPGEGSGGNSESLLNPGSAGHLAAFGEPYDGVLQGTADGKQHAGCRKGKGYSGRPAVAEQTAGCRRDGHSKGCDCAHPSRSVPVGRFSGG